MPLVNKRETARTAGTGHQQPVREDARREFLRSIELNPKYLRGHMWYAFFCLQFSEGQLAEGMMEAKLALASDPLSGYAHAIYGLTYMNAGKIDEAIQSSRRAVELDSENYFARIILQESLRLNREFEESVAVGESVMAMSGRCRGGIGHDVSCSHLRGLG